MTDSQLASVSVGEAVSQIVLSQSVRRSVTQFVSLQVSQLLSLGTCKSVAHSVS